MGLAVLPARLQKEMQLLADAILEEKDTREIESIRSHADWVDEWKNRYEITEENIMEILHKEIADCFVEVLECAGVFKRTEEGKKAFQRFLKIL